MDDPLGEIRELNSLKNFFLVLIPILMDDPLGVIVPIPITVE